MAPYRDSICAKVAGASFKFGAMGTALCALTYGQEALAQLVQAPAPAASAVSAAPAASGAAASDKAATDGHAPRTSDGATTLSSVIITANRRREAAKDVAGSVSVLGGGRLEELNAPSLQDFASFVSGLQVSGDRPGSQQQIIRGITTGYLQIGATTATYLDESPISASTTLFGGAQLSPDVDSLDLERIEVLKGPQGSLYGANAEGGLIKYVTVAPSLDAIEGRAEVGVNSTHFGGTGYSGRFAINVPVVKDLFAIRVTAYSRDDAGYITDASRGKDNLNEVKNEGARLSALFKPDPGFNARLTLDTQRISSPDSALMQVDPATLTPRYGDLRGQYKLAQPFGYDYYRGALTLNYDLGFANLLSVSSYMKNTNKQVLDYSPYVSYLDFLTAAGYAAAGLPVSPLGITAAAVDENYSLEKKTQELRLTSPGGGRFEWLGGLYYSDEKVSELVNYPAYGGAAAPYTLLVPNYIKFNQDVELKESAVYANSTYKLTDTFDVQFGGRYAHLEQSSVTPLIQTFNYFTGMPFVQSEPANSSSENKATYLISPRLLLSSTDMVYARVASGYRPGGPNTVTPSGITVRPPFKSDSIVNYEIGYKGVMPSANLDVTATLFRIDWKGIQLSAVDATTGYGYYTNGGKAHSQGLELESGWRPISQLRFSAALTLLEAKLDEDVAAVGGKAGDNIPNTARVAAALSADYSVPLGDGQLSFGASERYVDKRDPVFPNQAATPFAPTLKVPSLPSYELLDLRAAYAFDRWTLGFYVKNALDKRAIYNYNPMQVITNPTTGANSPASVAVANPRTVGLTLRADF